MAGIVVKAFCRLFYDSAAICEMVLSGTAAFVYSRECCPILSDSNYRKACRNTVLRYKMGGKYPGENIHRNCGYLVNSGFLYPC